MLASKTIKLSYSLTRRKLAVLLAALMMIESQSARTFDAVAVSDHLPYWKLDETSGVSYTDLEGSYTGQCAGSCPSPTTGQVQAGQAFNGSSSGIAVPGHSSFNWSGNDSFSIELWMKGEPGQTCAAGDEVFIGRTDSSTGLHWSIGCTTSSGRAFFRLEDSNGIGLMLESNKVITNGVWHHIVGMRDGTNNVNYLYVDGIEVISATQAYTGDFVSTIAPLTLGYLDTGSHFAGTLDEVALYNRLLPVTEIRTHYYLARGYTVTETCERAVRVMPLGDSITRGTGTSPRTGYRQPLYLSLVGANYSVNFIGSQKDGESAVPSFDYDHEGHGGWHAKGGESGGIAANVFNWLNTHPADVVLLHTGTNDIASKQNVSEVVTEVGELLDEIERYDPSITVIIARIVNRVNIVGDRYNYVQATTNFNTLLHNMANSRIANGSKVIVVDHESALTYPNDLFDERHPNAMGYSKMANVWLDAFEEFIPVCNLTYLPLVTK